MRQRRLNAFAIILDFCMASRGHTCTSLVEAIECIGDGRKRRSFGTWRHGQGLPRHRESFKVVHQIEQHFDLPSDYLTHLVVRDDSALEKLIKAANPRQQVVLRWHLPPDFDTRSREQQDEMLAWTSVNVMPCATDYGKYQSRASQIPFAIVFPSLDKLFGGRTPRGSLKKDRLVMGREGSCGTVAAPARLAEEMRALVTFKTGLLAPRGYTRGAQWLPSTASYQVRRYGELFGALAAAPLSPAGGLGVPPSKLTFGLLVFPAVWDWYVHWREQRRGFLTMSERSILYEAKSTSRAPTGWLRQHRELARRLHPIKGLVSQHDVIAARRDWTAACDKVFYHTSNRVTEVHRAGRAHRDPFAPILPCLESDNPLGEYKKIADEIMRLMHEEAHTPIKAASAVRAYVMFRLAVHLGVRQKNLRELLFCPRDARPRSVRLLERLRRGEIRWSESKDGWEVFIPSIAFKNRRSSFFRGRPFQMQLPDLDGLYHWIDHYIQQSRPLLMSGYPDPGTFLVRTAEQADGVVEYDIYAFYEAWKAMTERYGIYNPYTGRGAIKGLLPHGPHCVRDVLATHVLKQTCSYELAAFAIQDTVAVVMRHYARFLPHEKPHRQRQC